MLVQSEFQRSVYMKSNIIVLKLHVHVHVQLHMYMCTHN